MEQLALFSPSRSLYVSLSLPLSLSLFLSPFLVSRSLGDLPKLGYGRREDVRISYYRKYILIGHRWTLCAILIRSIRYYETYFLSMNRDNR